MRDLATVILIIAAVAWLGASGAQQVRDDREKWFRGCRTEHAQWECEVIWARM